MTALLQQQTKLAEEWNARCQSNHEDFVSFFEAQQTNILSSGSPWFLESLIQNDNIETVQYILQRTDPQKYINLKCTANSQQTPIEVACYYSTFPMVKLIVQNGGIFPTENTSGLIYSLLEFNTKMKGEEMYLTVEYLLNNLHGKINAGGIRFVLLYGRSHGMTMLPVDCIQMADLIKEKRSYFVANLSTTNCFGVLDIKYSTFNFAFADYLVEHAAKLDPVLFACTPSNAVIQWLLKHNVDINGNTENERITPLFRCCILGDSPHQKYKIMEALLNNGADINAKCIYQNKEITPLEYLKQTLPNNYFEYFKNYNPNANGGDTLAAQAVGDHTNITAQTSSDEISSFGRRSSPRDGRRGRGFGRRDRSPRGKGRCRDRGYGRRGRGFARRDRRPRERRDRRPRERRGRGRGRGRDRRPSPRQRRDKQELISIDLQTALNIIDDQIEMFSNQYNKNKLEEILSKSPQQILNKQSSFNEELILYENIANNIINKTNQLKQSVLSAKNNIDLLSKPNIRNYENWTINEAITWIVTLENGKFRKYEDKLLNGFRRSEITGDIIPDIDKIELQSYGIHPLKDRMSLVQHFKSLRVMQNVELEGQNDHQTELM